MTQGLGSGIQPLFASVNSLLIFMIIFIFFNDFKQYFSNRAICILCYIAF